VVDDDFLEYTIILDHRSISNNAILQGHLTVNFGVWEDDAIDDFAVVSDCDVFTYDTTLNHVVFTNVDILTNQVHADLGPKKLKSTQLANSYFLGFFPPFLPFLPFPLAAFSSFGASFGGSSSSLTSTETGLLTVGK
jgi:hypothetical protein